MTQPPEPPPGPPEATHDLAVASPVAPPQNFGPYPWHAPEQVAPVDARKTSLRRWVVIAAIIALLGTAGAIVAFVAMRQAVRVAAQVPPTPRERPMPSVVVITEKPAAEPPRPVRLVTATTLLGRPTLANAALQKHVEALAAGMMSSVSGATSSISHVYGHSSKDAILVGAVAGTFEAPERLLEAIDRGFATADGFKNFQPFAVETGPLGGEAQCGDTTQDDIPIAVCLWVDAGSVGFVYFLFRKASTVGKDFVQARGELELVG
jgi:hypothetical protein